MSLFACVSRLLKTLDVTEAQLTLNVVLLCSRRRETTLPANARQLSSVIVVCKLCVVAVLDLDPCLKLQYAADP